jgi:hypothetical protein
MTKNHATHFKHTRAHIYTHTQAHTHTGTHIHAHRHTHTPNTIVVPPRCRMRPSGAVSTLVGLAALASDSTMENT